MYIFLIVLLGLLLIPIIYGPSNAQQIDFIFEVKKLSSPTYRIGISYEYIDKHNGLEQYEFSLGLFFVNFVFVFYKTSA